MGDPADIIAEGAQILGIMLKPEAVDKMLRHIDLLLDWGGKINLTNLRKPQEIAVLHFLDSLTVFKVLPAGLELSILDIGTGGGFPGLVLKIAGENLNLTLLDRDTKKIVFLKYAANALNLQKIRFMNIPFKQLIENPDRPIFDLVVSRAFSSDSNLLDSLNVLLRPRGMLVRMAGPAALKESFTLKHFEHSDRWEGTLPFSTHFRTVTLYTKIDQIA